MYRHAHFFKLTCFIDSSHIPLWLCLIGFRNDYWIFEVGRFVTLYIWKLRMNLEIFNSKFDSTNSTLKMCEKLGHWRDSNPRPPYPRRRVSILVTNVLTTRPQRPLILLQRQITNIHTLSFLSSFVLGVLVILKPQVCIVSTAQVHIPSRYTHTKCSPFWSDVPTCTFF